VLYAGVVDEDVDAAEGALAARIIRSISAGLLMSAPSYIVFTPCFCNCASAARIASGSPKPLDDDVGPWAASASAMASPIPLVDPVTRAVFPFSMQTSLCGGRVCHCRLTTMPAFSNVTKTLNGTSPVPRPVP